jgi:hypothetical protein
MTTVETIEVRQGERIRIVHDDDCTSPREYDNLGTIVTWHPRYTLGDKQVRMDDYDSATEVQEMIQEEHDPRVILPVWLLDHSGLYLSAGAFNSDPQGWDSGVVGFIFDTPERHKVMGTGDFTDEQIAEALKGELEEYGRYVAGETYGYVYEKAEVCDHGDTHWDEIDSCWGFIGLEYAISEAKLAADMEG